MKLLTAFPLAVLIVCTLVLLQSAGCSVTAAPNPQPRASLASARLTEFKADLSPPAKWKPSKREKSGTHIAREWTSPSGSVTFGMVYIHVPPFMPASALVKSVQDHYAKDQSGGKITKKWEDSDERHWFEVHGSQTNSKGFVIAHDGKAWFAYYRYPTRHKKPKKQIKQAQHAMQSVHPWKEN